MTSSGKSQGRACWVEQFFKRPGSEEGRRGRRAVRAVAKLGLGRARAMASWRLSINYYQLQQQYRIVIDHSPPTTCAAISITRPICSACTARSSARAAGPAAPMSATLRSSSSDCWVSSPSWSFTALITVPTSSLGPTSSMMTSSSAVFGANAPLAGGRWGGLVSPSDARDATGTLPFPACVHMGTRSGGGPAGIERSPPVSASGAVEDSFESSRKLRPEPVAEPMLGLESFDTRRPPLRILSSFVSASTSSTLPFLSAMRALCLRVTMFRRWLWYTAATSFAVRRALRCRIAIAPAAAFACLLR
mmetsp:Transcript_58003/g.184253  ORF Transcript_58003/g.184253 Transcript_58003/m.184253 type:complete len:305 (-) Transcript_58003:2008-2922(-)